MYSQRVFRVGALALANGIPEKYVGCPFLVCGRETDAIVNAFLRDMHAGTWRGPRRTATGSPAGWLRKSWVHRPMPSSLVQHAQSLLNLSDWCAWSAARTGERRGMLGLDDDRLERYGDDMETGRWSKSGLGLSQSTIALRQIAAIYLNEWAYEKAIGPEPRFALRRSRKKTPMPSGSALTITTESYAVVRRPAPARVRFPTADQVAAAVASVPDPVMRLVHEAIYRTGLRSAEVFGLPVAAFSAAGRQGTGVRHVLVLGKGKKLRHVDFPADLYDRIERYVDLERKMRARPADGNKGHLFISDVTGERYSYAILRRSFLKSGKAAHTYITPHLGRHFYVIQELLRCCRRDLGTFGTEALAGMRASSFVNQTDLLRISQNLGHAQLSTMQRYTVALAQYTDVAGVGVNWQKHLDRFPGAGGHAAGSRFAEQVL